MDFIGYDDRVEQLSEWIKLNLIGAHSVEYALIVGTTGNGKTYLCEQLAKEHNAELFRVTPDEITSMEDVKQLFKSFNLIGLSSEKKIILIDDFDEFRWNYREKLYDIPRHSNYPVIYTANDCNKTYTKVFKNEFKKEALQITYKTKTNQAKSTPFLRLEKDTQKLYMHLLSLNTGKTTKELMDIASKSQSIRSALISIKYSSEINSMNVNEKKSWEVVSDMYKRKIEYPITLSNPYNIHTLISNIHSSKNISSLSKVTDRLLDFEHRLKYKYERFNFVEPGVDPIFFNHMNEPVEHVFFKAKFKKKSNKKKFNNKPKEKEKQKPKKVENSVDKWF